MYSVSPENHALMFEALESAVRGMGRTLASNDSQVIRELDDALSLGAMLKFTFSIGGAGSIGCSLELVRIDGHALELFVLHPPAAAAPFRFDPP